MGRSAFAKKHLVSISMLAAPFTSRFTAALTLQALFVHRFVSHTSTSFSLPLRTRTYWWASRVA